MSMLGIDAGMVGCGMMYIYEVYVGDVEIE